MDRRGFLRSIGLGIGGIALEQAIPLGRVWSFPTKIAVSNHATIQRIDKLLIEHWGPFEIEEGGVLSLHGQSVFPIYDQSGNPTTSAIEYRVKGGTVQSYPSNWKGSLRDLPRYPLGRARVRSVDKKTNTITLDSIPA